MHPGLSGRHATLPAVVCLAACCLLAACQYSAAGPPPAQRWTTGFWLWATGWGKVPEAGRPVDALYCQALRAHNYGGPGGRRDWFVSGSLPDSLPPARQYWVVLRLDAPGLPPAELIPKLLPAVQQLRSEAARRNLSLAGLQLDIDSLTASLGQYAAFLKAVRKALPPELEISITALLDWFRPGTDIAAVVAAVDEFVPQFYDLGPEASGGELAIAAPVDARKWGPAFNRFGKRYRIGIASFGRAQLVYGPHSTSRRAGQTVTYTGLRPLDVALATGFQLESSRTPAGELRLTYRAQRRTEVGYQDLDPGDAVVLTLATTESIGAAVAEARLMHGSCAGVVFFRWPGPNEMLAAPPAEVLAAAGAGPAPAVPQPRLAAVRGDCALSACTDLHLAAIPALAPRPTVYRVTSTAAFEYFLPNRKLPVRVAGPARVELTLPPFGGAGRLYLGRAVTAQPAQFRLEVLP